MMRSFWYGRSNQNQASGATAAPPPTPRPPPRQHRQSTPEGPTPGANGPASPPPPTSLDKRKAPRAQRIWKRLRLPAVTHAPARPATIGVFPLPRHDG
ncbi:hypothetical protein G6F24_016337 [Rhizopus arrhizus]|nr:hypothetical protein G6F24_016337 [Rhizopus arrhizus]